MIRTMNKLSVLHDSNSVFADYSNKAVDYGRDSFSFTLINATDYLYIGFYKPINSAYIELSTVSTTETAFSGEYYAGAWTSLTGFHDDTAALKRSGFFQWDRNLSNEVATTINGVEQFWYRFKPDADTSAVVFDGINIVFADDEDLRRELYEISKWVPSGQNSHILTHVAARDEMVQSIRNNGNKKLNGTVKKDITAFDLLDVEQVKTAATYLAMAKIFSAITDDPDDTYRQKSLQYRTMYDGAMNLVYLNVDRDDDGVRDTSETLEIQFNRLVRR